MLKVAAAVNAMSATSSRLRERLGMAYAAIATITPSTKYLMVRLTSSPKSKTLDIGIVVGLFFVVYYYIIYKYKKEKIFFIFLMFTYIIN